ncbi:MAG: hypothetical protein JW738_01460 [Actinobacteria bacterium]|nr:hypothetical protein [Actinomycetota bacterium]
MAEPEGQEKETKSREKEKGAWRWNFKAPLKQNIHELISFLFYLIASCFFTWPVISNLSGVLYGLPSDNLGTVWIFWWYRNAGTFGSNLTFCPIIGFPFGQSMNAVYSEFIYQLSAQFLMIFFNEVTVTNLFVFTSFFLSGITMYYLVRHITGSKPAAFVGGFAYMICTYHTFNAMFFPNLAMIQWMPLAMLMLIRLIEKPNLKNTLFLWLSLVLTAGTCVHYGLFTIIFTVAFTAGYFIYLAACENKAIKKSGDVPVKGSGTLRRRTIVFILAAILATTVIIIPFFTLSLSGNDTSWQYSGIPTAGGARNLENDIAGSAKPKDYVIPFFKNFTLGRLVKNPDLSTTGLFRSSLYIGWTILALAAIALVIALKRKRKEGREPAGGENCPLPESRSVKSLFAQADKRALFCGFFLGGLTAFLFSLSPYVYIGNLKIPFPSLVFYYTVPWLRWYLRFGIVVAACAIVIACFAIQHLVRNKGMRWQYAAALVLAALIFCETAIVPPFQYFTIEKPPEIFLSLKELPEDSSLVIYPAFEQGFFNSQMYLLYQRDFRKPLLNGAADGTEGEALRRTVYNPYNPAVPSILSRFGITNVLYLGEMFEQYEGTKPKKEEILNLPKGLVQIDKDENDDIFADGYIFEVDADPALLVPFYAGEITAPHIDEGLETVRLLAGLGNLLIENFMDETVEADIVIPVTNLASPHHLQILIDGKIAWEGDLGADQQELISLAGLKIPKNGLVLQLVPSGPLLRIDPGEAAVFGSSTAFLKLGDITVEPKVIP